MFCAYGVQYHPWFQASTGTLRIYPLWRGVDGCTTFIPSPMVLWSIPCAKAEFSISRQWSPNQSLKLISQRDFSFNNLKPQSRKLLVPCFFCHHHTDVSQIPPSTMVIAVSQENTLFEVNGQHCFYQKQSSVMWLLLHYSTITKWSKTQHKALEKGLLLFPLFCFFFHGIVIKRNERNWKYPSKSDQNTLGLFKDNVKVAYLFQEGYLLGIL